VLTITITIIIIIITIITIIIGQLKVHTENSLRRKILLIFKIK